MSRRRKHRKRRSEKVRTPKSLMVVVAFVMLCLTLALVIPVARHQRITFLWAAGMTLALWGVSVFALWACVNSGRRRYSHGRPRYSTYTDYSEVEFEDVPPESAAPQPGESKTSH